MKVFSIAKGFHGVTKNAPPELSQKERDKLRAIRLYRETGDVKLVCNTFEISRATLYRWLKRFNPMDLTTVEEKSRKPKRLRKANWSYELIIAVKGLRQQYPRWGKEKLYPSLKAEGWHSSESTVGRIISYLKNKGQLIEPQRKAISAKRKVKRPYAIKKPKDYTANNPGDLVQVHKTIT